eukprot:scaffold261208_cov26-Tisochrysis_lutea.AAC.1
MLIAQAQESGSPASLPITTRKVEEEGWWSAWLESARNSLSGAIATVPAERTSAPSAASRVVRTMAPPSTDERGEPLGAMQRGEHTQISSSLYYL